MNVGKGEQMIIRLKVETLSVKVSRFDAVMVNDIVWWKYDGSYWYHRRALSHAWQIWDLSTTDLVYPHLRLVVDWVMVHLKLYEIQICLSSLLLLVEFCVDCSILNNWRHDAVEELFHNQSNHITAFFVRSIRCHLCCLNSERGGAHFLMRDWATSVGR